VGTGLDATPYTRHRPAAVVAVVFMVPQARSLSIYPSIYATYCPRLLAALSLSLPSLTHGTLFLFLTRHLVFERPSGSVLRSVFR